MYRKHLLLFAISLGVLLACLLAAQAAFQPARAAGGEPTPAPDERPASTPAIATPVVPENPSLADKGSVTWWGVCMACHGDKGQGLTEEWRRTGYGEDMDCWQSKCHASNHPPDGFELPRAIPAAFGPGTLRRFVTASQLQRYLRQSMPWWNPGSLSEETAWELTAFILREHASISNNGRPLSFPSASFDIRLAGLTPVHLPNRPQGKDWALEAAILACLGLAAGITWRLAPGPRASRESSATSGAEVAAAKAPSRPNFFHHLHPPTIPLPQARWRYTLGAGGLSVFLCLVLGVTGALEMFFYIPTPEQAAASNQVITFLVPFGRLVRGIHFWAAQALVVVAVLHLLRVALTGACVRPRRFNYLLGLALLVLILLLDFTGYVLRWDEGIRWALTVGTNLSRTVPLIGEALYGMVVGGEQPGLATLTRFYAWHVFGLTLAVVGLGIWHLFRLRRDGGISAPPPELRRDTRRISRAELLRREGLAMLVAGILLILLGALAPAPLEPPIQAGSGPLLADARAPWFFLWVQQLLRYGDAFWMGVGVPLGVLAVLAALPFIFPRLAESERGRWLPRSGRLPQIVVSVIVLAWLALTILELLE